MEIGGQRESRQISKRYPAVLNVMLQLIFYHIYSSFGSIPSSVVLPNIYILCSFNIFGSLFKINIVFPTSVWSEASEKSEYLMNFRHIFVFSLASLQTDAGNTILTLSSEPKMLKEHRTLLFRNS